MNDPVVTFTAGGEELGRSDDTVELLGSAALHDLLDERSAEALRRAVAQPPAYGLELRALDGRVFDASVAIVPSGVAVFLRDVSRYVNIGSRLPEVEAELARREEDLQMLANAMTELGTTVDTHELGDLTCRVVAITSALTAWSSTPRSRPSATSSASPPGVRPTTVPPTGCCRC